MHPFQKADILLPQGVSLEKWSVIACDQFVSQPEYWEQVRQTVAGSPSSLNLILPCVDIRYALYVLFEFIDISYLENHEFKGGECNAS